MSCEDPAPEYGYIIKRKDSVYDKLEYILCNRLQRFLCRLFLVGIILLHLPRSLDLIVLLRLNLLICFCYQSIILKLTIFMMISPLVHRNDSLFFCVILCQVSTSSRRIAVAEHRVRK